MQKALFRRRLAPSPPPFQERNVVRSATRMHLPSREGAASSFLVFLTRARCCGGLLRGPHQGDVGRVGGAGVGVVLSRGDGRRVPDGAHQQYLGLLCWLRPIQVLLHAPHHHHDVSFFKTTHFCGWRNNTERSTIKTHSSPQVTFADSRSNDE